MAEPYRKDSRVVGPDGREGTVKVMYLALAKRRVLWDDGTESSLHVSKLREAAPA